MTARGWSWIGFGGGAGVLLLAAGVTVASWHVSPEDSGCSTCDARHQRLAELRAGVSAVTPEPDVEVELTR
jgi:hypothetical protein